MSRPVIVVGSGGHAKVVIDVLLVAGISVLGRTDRTPGDVPAELQGVPLLGDDGALRGHEPDAVELANGLGGAADTAGRHALFRRLKAAGYDFVTLRHPAAVIAQDSALDEGAQVMAGAVIQPACHIGANSLVNTGARVDHDCRIGDHAHVGPGAVLCGGVIVGEGCHVGAGGTVIQGVNIGAGAIVAAGAVVVHNVAPGARVAGVPAREMAA